MILGMLVISNLTVKSRLPPNKTPVVMMEFIKPFREPAYLLLTIASFLFFFGLFIPFTFLILQGRSIGMSPRLAAYLIPILNAASLFGRIFPGWIADRVGRFNVMIVTTFFSAVLVLALWRNAHTNASVIVFGALFGFGSGAYVSLGPALVAQISDVRQIGVRNGSLFAFVSLAALTGSPIAGAISARDHGGFEGLQVFSGTVMLVGAVFFAAARISLVGWKVAIRV
ncbi:MAG: hypothetical protein M1832_003143 [Thelocarpon impressellum]|nr:MAG: hypothetical protein M1832_003143 [Thelocarpon impressellum]